ncbi:acyltransferase family protein, partial [Leucobacter sp. M11]|uniref:acyltransferase family protein n=1 Tax=Leucobacter sp. M11 TaxID=2993565 RepID=UPI002D7EAE3E
TATSRSEAYFNTLTRVWEFMAGALVALAVPWLLRRFGTRWRGSRAHLLRGLAQWLGLAMIAASALSFDTETPFPGPWALVPVLGTALVILAGPESPRWSPAAWLAIRPVQLAGDLSYSLYLWHWPLIVLAPALLGRELRFRDRLVILAATVALAWLTKRFVEDPGRTRLFVGRRPRVPLLATLASVLVVAVLASTVSWGAAVTQERDAQAAAALVAEPCFGAGSLAPGAECPDPFGPAQIPAQGEHETPWFAPEECALAAEDQILAGGSPSIVACDFSAGSGAAGPSGEDGGEEIRDVWLFGDSHAEHWKGAVYDLARGNGWRVTSSLQGGCPIVDLPRVAFKGTADQNSAKATSCQEWSREVTDRIRRDAPDLVLVSAFGAAETVDDGTDRAQLEQYRGPSVERLRAWAAEGTRVVVLRDVPVSSGQLTAACVEQRPDAPAECSAPRAEALPADPLAEAAASLPDPGIAVVDLSERFCSAERCFAVVGGVPVYFDADHLSRSFSQSLAPALGAKLSEAIGVPLAEPLRAP